MDRYVIREPRVGMNYRQGNEMMTFPINGGTSNMIASENIYYEGYPKQFSNTTPMRQVPSNSTFMGAPQMNQSAFTQNLVPCQGQIMSGIDPRYLAGYSDSSHFIATGQSVHTEVNPVPMNARFGNDYQTRTFTGPDKRSMKIYGHQTVVANCNKSQCETSVGTRNFVPYDDRMKMNHHNQHAKVEPVQHKPNEPVKKSTENDAAKGQIVMMSRSEKLKALYKSGPRAFSGPVEKVLKWHKALQDIGVFVFYEIVAKCVSIRPGESCSKNLVIRDDNGPAMQVVYYEIDFLLPELKPPCVVRVIGKMMAGTCRLQAFSVRKATGDDVATLPRRAAVATHHVARLCKEYGIST